MGIELRFKNIGVGMVRSRRGRPTDNREFSPAIELITPAGGPVCFVMPQDARQLVDELVRTWRSGSWLDIQLHTKIVCSGENDEDSSQR